MFLYSFVFLGLYSAKQFLYSSVFSIHQKGNTALHIASLAGQADVVKMLVKQGAEINSQSQVRDTVARRQLSCFCL